MRKAFVILAVVTAVAMVSGTSLAQGYGFVNDDNPAANSLTSFKVSAVGGISLFESLKTGGTGLGGGYFAIPRIAVGGNADCIFVSDSGSNDIAAFQLPSLKKAPTNFTDGRLAGNVYGIGLAVDPAGKFLYTAWSASHHIAVLAIAADCSLSLVDIVGGRPSTPDYFVGLTVTHDGKVLVASYPNTGTVFAYATSATGTLTPFGPVLIFGNVISSCASLGCAPVGQDVTDDGQYWVWGNAGASVASTLTATLTPKGFTNAAIQTYPDSTLQDVEMPWFSPAAAKTDTGNLYLAASGFGFGSPAGIIVTSFNKGTITYDSETVNHSAYYAGAVQTIGTTGTGSPLVQIASDSFANNTLYSFTVNGTTLTPASSFQDPVSGGFAFSIAAFPRRP